MFEFNFISFVIKNSVKNCREKFGDKYTCLFRQDTLLDEIIKHMFYVFANKIIIRGVGIF